MKRILLILLLGCLASLSYAEEVTINRAGFHVGLGANVVVSADVSNEDREVIPVVNLSLEYG